VGNAGFGWEQNLFTADGAHWFCTPSPPDDTTPMIQVGRTDDPAGPRFDLIPEGTSLFNAWLLADGRMLTAVYTDFAPRSDVFAVNLDTGESVQLAERGRVAAVGQTRFVGMFHYDRDYRGDLTTVELDSGRQTILAPEFAVTAFVEPQGADLVPPGARVVFVDASTAGTLGSGIIAADGSATLPVSGLTIGAHTVYAVVAGIDGIEGSTSAPFTVTITP